jgi:hypothetical protein
MGGRSRRIIGQTGPWQLVGLAPAATRQPAKATPLAGGYLALSEKAPQATFSNELGYLLSVVAVSSGEAWLAKYSATILMSSSFVSSCAMLFITAFLRRPL